MPAAILAIIEVLTAAFSRLISTQIGRWFLQALLFFGISFVSNKVVSGVVSPTLAAAFAGMGGQAVAWMSFFNIDRAITTILSAYATLSATRWTISHAASSATSASSS